MKICAYIFFISFGFAVSKYSEDILLPEDIECAKELGLETDAILANVSDGIIITEGLPEINKYILCSYVKLNGYDISTRIINFKTIKPVMIGYANIINGGKINQEQIVDDALEACKTIEGIDHGDRLVKFNNCVMRKFNV